MSLASLLVSLNLNTTNFSAKLSQASQQMKSFATNASKGYEKATAELSKHTLGLKDTARIVQGIMISQAFYGIAQAVRGATSALTEFNEQLDYANVTYSALFGSADLASDFTRVLQEHSVDTIFDYQDLADASKKMLAYGIEYKNLMYVMQGLTEIGTLSGDKNAMGRAALAIGQINTRGTLKAEEMRQLANAYVPIYDIIQSKLGLTGDEMGNVGDLGIPAYQAINAIVEYANEKFGSVATAAMYTITGLKNRIVDTMKVLGSEMMMPLTKAWKSFLAFVADGLQVIRDNYAAGGWGGIFESFVPDPAQQTVIRAFLANVHNLIMTVASALSALAPIIGQVGQTFMLMFNIVSPILSGFANLLSAVVKIISDSAVATAALRLALLTASAAFIILKINAMRALVVTAVTSAVNKLSGALLILSSIMAKNWLVFGLVALGAGLLGIAVAGNNADNSMSKLFKTLTGFGGVVNQDDILKTTEKDLEDSTSALDKFNNKMSAGSSAANELSNSLNKTDKAAKKAGNGLLSFDEVFKLPDEKDSGGTGAALLDDLDGLMDGLNALNNDFDLDIPDFSDYISSFTDGLFNGLRDSLLAKLTFAGLGAWLASKLLAVRAPLTGPALLFVNALKAALMGAFLGYAWDAVASLVTDKLWAALEKSLKLSEGSAETAKLGSTIGSVLGGAIGMVIGGLPGGLIGAAVGQLAGGFVGLLWDEIGGALNNTVIGAVGGIAKALAPAMTSILSTLPGMLNAGTLAGIFGNIGNAISKTGLKAIAKGGVIGMAIGFIVDGIAALLWNGLAEKFNLGEDSKETAKIGQTIGSTVGMILGGLLGGPVGAIIGSAIGTFAGGLAGLFFKPMSEKISVWFNEMGTFIAGAWSTLWDPATWKSGWSTVRSWFSNLWTDIRGWFSGLGSSIASWWDGLWDDKSATVALDTPGGRSTAGGRSATATIRHATGGIFNREHVARFAEGNKAEAVVPLENASAMQPFVNLIANGVAQGLAPQLAALATAGAGSGQGLPPVYVGTLIADEKGLKELERKMRIIRVQEERRGN